MKIIKRILVGVLIILLAFILFLAGSVAVDGLIGGGRLDSVTNTDIPNINGPSVRAFVARPAEPGTYPAVIMIHEFWGLNEDITGKARALADEGYVVVAPDLFRGSTTRWVPRAIYQVVSTPQSQLDIDLDAVYAWLGNQPDVQIERTGIMGFCFGGGTSLRYSLHNNQLAATAIFYGSPVTDPQQLKSLPAPVLGIFGGADASIPLEEVRAFEAGLDSAGIEKQITIYENQPHAFVTDIESIRRGGVQGEAWDELLVFLRTHLQNDVSSRTPTFSTIPAFELDFGYYLALVYEHAFGSAHAIHPGMD